MKYISSAGLRVLLKLHKRLGGLTVVETSPEVYDIFDVTGFSQLMDVRKRLRELSVEGCELIGRGGNGTVYRLDPETIVKVYYSTTETLEKIQASRASAQKLLAYGVPVAIAFDVVRVGDDYGLVYELLDCKTVGQLIHEDPSSIGYWAKQAADLLKQLHATEVPAGTFPDERDSGHRWVDVAKSLLSDEQQARLHRVYDTMPAKNTLVHGDFHAGNMMVQGDEIVLIDTDDVAQGDPIIDLAGMELTFGFISTEEQAQLTMGVSLDEMNRYYDAFLKEYYGTDDEALLQRYAAPRKMHGLVKLLYGLSKTNRVPQEVKDQVVPQMRAGLMQLLDAMGM
ncbi:MAG: phosphotransferase [Atopobiaceae bacterium]|nr:phosphotransferase [Atopobiaceae bacterium]